MEKIVFEKLKLLKDLPGCYLMKDQNQKVIYVGKAKSLKNRVRSYFNNQNHNAKTNLLVSEIYDFDYIITNSEKESLILENNLIKKYLPKYNIRLVDDKSYPYICIVNNENPKIIVKRDKHINYNAFGPYPNANYAKKVVELLNRLFPYKKGIQNNTEQDIYYNMGKTLDNNLEIKYLDKNQLTKEVEKLLNGDNSKIIKLLEKRMEEESSKLNFELAQYFKEHILSLKQVSEKQLVETNDFKNRDIIGFVFDENYISVCILIQRRGKIVDSKKQIFEYINSPNIAILQYIDLLYSSNIYIDEILFSNNFNKEDIEERFKNKAIIPKIGYKKELMDLCLKNANEMLLNYNQIYTLKDEITKKGLSELEAILGFYPSSIEAFDNAQMYGQGMISGMIYLLNGVFIKHNYRKFKLQSLNTSDYHLMIEVLNRRYKRLKEENEDLPSLIVLDGGKIQINACISVLNNLNLSIPILGLVKNDKHKLEKIIYKDKEFVLEKNSNLYKFLGSISEEVHRFSITYHKNVRLKQNFKSPLENVYGLGPKLLENIYKNIKDINELKDYTEQDFKKIGINKKLGIRIKEVVENESNN